MAHSTHPQPTRPSPRLPASFHTCTPMDGRHFRCRARLRSSSLPGMVLMMSVGGLGLARGGTGANSRVRAPMAGPSSPSAELQRRAGPSAAVKLSWAESVLLWAVMEMRGGAWLPGGMGGGAFLKLKAAARDAETQRVRKAARLPTVRVPPPHAPTRCPGLHVLPRAEPRAVLPIIHPRGASDLPKVTTHGCGGG